MLWVTSASYNFTSFDGIPAQIREGAQVAKIERTYLDLQMVFRVKG